jgi:integrase
MSSDLFKVPTTEYWLNPGTEQARRVGKGTPDAVAVRKESRKWYAWIGGRRVPLSANKAAARIMLGEKTKKAALADAGASDPFERHRNRPLAEHLDDWQAAMKAGGAGAKHHRQRVACVRAVLDGCRFVLPGDLAASRVLEFVAALRDRAPSLVLLDPAKTEYTCDELAAVLGVKRCAIKPLIRRHQLQAAGNGKARRYPRETVEALRSLRSRGKSIRTSNVYLVAVKQFARWMVRDRRMGDNPLAHLTGGNEKLDPRHNRRPLAACELRAVIHAALQSGRAFRGLDGQSRGMLYSVACATGFRAGELASLRSSDFDLAADPPAVTLRAENAKNGRTAVQPLPGELVDALQRFLAGRDPAAPVWSGTWAEKAAAMFRDDLDTAGVPYIVEGPDGPLFADFHCLRHSFIALLDKSGATLKEAMQLARHSDPRLTMAVYGRAQLHDLGEAVGRLPALLSAPDSEPKMMRATGTDDDLVRGIRWDSVMERTQ